MCPNPGILIYFYIIISYIGYGWLESYQFLNKSLRNRILEDWSLVLYQSCKYLCLILCLLVLCQMICKILYLVFFLWPWFLMFVLLQQCISIDEIFEHKINFEQKRRMFLWNYNDFMYLHSIFRQIFVHSRSTYPGKKYT